MSHNFAFARGCTYGLRSKRKASRMTRPEGMPLRSRAQLGAQNLVADIFSLMRSIVVVVVRHPFPVDVVELINAQAKDNGLRQQTVSEPNGESRRDATAKQSATCQALMFVRPNIALTKGIGLRRAWRDLKTSYVEGADIHPRRK